jgi:uncharacterized membrane protein
MEGWVLLGLAVFAYALLPFINLLRQNSANARVRELEKSLRETRAQLAALRESTSRMRDAAADAKPQPLPTPLPTSVPMGMPTPATAAPPQGLPVPPREAAPPLPPVLDVPPLPVATAPAVPMPEPISAPSLDRAVAAATASAQVRTLPPDTPARPPLAVPAPAPVARPAPVPPRWVLAAKAWLFGGNLVAKVGLLILFIGLAFLLRLAAEYVVVPVEVWHAVVAGLATGLLWWGWRIRETRAAIGLPTQGAALGMLMLVTFSAYRLFELIPGGAAFGLLFALVVFTCLLAGLQDAMWLAIFGIAGGFAVPILTSRGGGSHIGLFSYYALLNAGILALALKKAWRPLNLLGFAFTFVIGASWGVLRYTPEHYLSTQLFLALFLLFYIAIAVLYAQRQAPRLKSYVDGTLVFGVPLAAMGLQHGLVREMPLGMALSALGLGLVYATLASVLWRRRQGSLRLLVESFMALAIVFCTLCIPLAVDGRWTSAAWALEGAAITWMGLRQQRALAWRFGLLVQFGSWIAFIAGLTGLDLGAALGGNLWLGFLVLGLTAALVAMVLRQHATGPAPGAGPLATGFITVAVVWLLAGAWVEVWLRTEGSQRATLLVLSAIALCALVLALSRKLAWSLPARLAQGVFGLAGLVFIAQVWPDLLPSEAQVLSRSLHELLFDGPLLGAALMCGGALWSALALNRAAKALPAPPARPEPQAAGAFAWWLAAAFWWFLFVLPPLAAAVSWLSARGPQDTDALSSWHYLAPLPVYALAMALSAAAWLRGALRAEFPRQSWTIQVFWPGLTALASALFAWHALDAAPWETSSGKVIAGALCLAACWARGAWRHHAGTAGFAGLGPAQRERGQKVALLGLAATWFGGVCVPWADMLQSGGWLQDGWVAYGLCVLLSAGGFAWLAWHKRWPLAGWLATPVWLVQLLVSGHLLQALYLSGHWPGGASWLLAGLAWLLSAALLEPWLRRLPPAPPGAAPPLVFDFGRQPLALQGVHLLRVVAPWLIGVGAIAVGMGRWLAFDTAESLEAGQDAWVVAGAWADYLAAWAGAVSLFGLLRLARRPTGSAQAWLLAPLQAQYQLLWIPVATLWAALLVVYWNLRQDGGMAPLPYLPVLNPLDLTTGLVAALVFALILPQAGEPHRPTDLRSLLWQSRARWGGGLAFAWFNLVLLRTASQWLDIPYRGPDLFASQFVQSMLSLVWSLSALVGMWWASKHAGRRLWMAGGALLGVVVVKLFLVDLSNVGSVARIVSFIGVGGLMLAIGYLAPLPTAAAASSETPP